MFASLFSLSLCLGDKPQNDLSSSAFDFLWNWFKRTRTGQSELKINLFENSIETVSDENIHPIEFVPLIG